MSNPIDPNIDHKVNKYMSILKFAGREGWYSREATLLPPQKRDLVSKWVVKLS